VIIDDHSFGPHFGWWGYTCAGAEWSSEVERDDGLDPEFKDTPPPLTFMYWVPAIISSTSSSAVYKSISAGIILGRYILALLSCRNDVPENPNSIRSRRRLEMGIWTVWSRRIWI
jgi:hypothetical protein